VPAFARSPWPSVYAGVGVMPSSIVTVVTLPPIALIASSTTPEAAATVTAIEPRQGRQADDEGLARPEVFVQSGHDRRLRSDHVGGDEPGDGEAEGNARDGVWEHERGGRPVARESVHVELDRARD
jgi:hypothetical protein